MGKTNLYMLTRSNISEAEFCNSMTGREHKRFRYDEFEMVREMVDALSGYGKSIRVFEGYEYSFSIPHISFEIDLLKIDVDGNGIDIELKSQKKEKEEIESQLIRNRHFLSFAAAKMDSFTVVKDGDSFVVYRLVEDHLITSDLHDLYLCMCSLGNTCNEEYESLFNPADYLASPINSPTKFLRGQYFLTPQQESFKKSILEKLKNGKSVLGITGKAGTGKTLLLYDIVRTLSEQDQVCVIHCGKLSEGHKTLQKECPNVLMPEINSLSSFTKEELMNVKFLFIDEAHRLRNNTFDRIIEVLFSEVKGVVFSFDYEQILSQSEKDRNIPERIKSMLTCEVFTLSEKIRTNEKLVSFINHMLVIRKNHTHHDYSNIMILWASSIEEAQKIIAYYEQEQGYKYINITPSKYISSVWDEFNDYSCSHDVIGQEFDNVIIMMDENYRYADGELTCRRHPNPDYLYYKLMYQAVSRARRKLCILVLENSELFTQLLRIKNEKYD